MVLVFVKPHWISKKTNHSLKFQTWAPLPKHFKSLRSFTISNAWVPSYLTYDIDRKYIWVQYCTRGSNRWSFWLVSYMHAVGPVLIISHSTLFLLRDHLSLSSLAEAMDEFLVDLDVLEFIDLQLPPFIDFILVLFVFLPTKNWSCLDCLLQLQLLMLKSLKIVWLQNKKLKLESFCRAHVLGLIWELIIMKTS